MGTLVVRAEEESILTGAQVNEQYLGLKSWYPGNDLIGPGFKNPIEFYSSVGDNSAEFQIVLTK